jgi:hypothetical protein
MHNEVFVGELAAIGKVREPISFKNGDGEKGEKKKGN